MEAAGAGADQGDGAGQQPGPLEPVERTEAVAVRLDVDVEHVGAGGAGGDGHVVVRLARPPAADSLLIGGGVLEAVGGGRFLAAGKAREHRPVSRRIAEGGGLQRPGLTSSTAHQASSARSTTHTTAGTGPARAAASGAKRPGSPHRQRGIGLRRPSGSFPGGPRPRTFARRGGTLCGSECMPYRPRRGTMHKDPLGGGVSVGPRESQPGALFLRVTGPAQAGCTAAAAGPSAPGWPCASSRRVG